MSVALRIIPCLDVDQGRVVKGTNFANLKDAGDPVELASRYDQEGADELTFLDITASSGSRETIYDVVRSCADKLFIPLTVGGGVRSVEDVDRLLRCGCDKVSVNTAAILKPTLINEISQRFGNQVLVLSVDTRRASGTKSGFEITTHGGRESSNLDAFEWVKQAQDRGVGEILLNSMDFDGTRKGFDLELIEKVRKIVSLPLIASGGAGEVEHFTSAARAGADAILAASVFHYREFTIQDVKLALHGAGFEVRL